MTSTPAKLAEQKFSAIYMPGWHVAALTAFFFLMPFWLQWLLASPIMALIYLCRGDYSSAVMYTCAFGATALFTYFVSNLFDNKIVVDADGLRLNKPLALSHGVKQQLSWNDVQSLRFVAVKGRSAENCMLEITLNTKAITVDLKNLRYQDKQRFVEALNHYDPSPEKDLQLISLQSFIEERNKGPKTFYGLETKKLLSPEQTILADKQVILRYSTFSQRAGLVACFLAFPVWGILGLNGITFSLIFGVLTDPYLFCLTPLFSMIFLSGVTASAYCFDTALTVGESGISFPMFLSPRLNLRRDRLWTELRKISLLRKAERPLEKSRLIFHVGKNLSVPLNLAYLKGKDLEMLLLALGIWGQRIETDNDVKLLQQNLADKKSGSSGGDSYTEMWEKELNRRFSSTCFVPLQPGHLLKEGSLSVVKQLAFGGMSAIYLAQMNRTDLRVLKEFVVPNSDPRLQEKAHELFEREAKLLMKLSHPRLAHVYDHFVEDGRTYLLLDYIPGTDLRQIVVQKGAQEEETVISWILQVCEVLTYLHTQHPPIIHRDLTPDNLLLTADEQIMLIDFGAANEFVGTATGTLVGKESFISPEQFRGDTVPQSDIYSLGATMHYLLTAEEPSPLSQSCPQKIKPELSSWINDVIANCTCFEASERLQTVQDLQHCLKVRNTSLLVEEKI